MIIQENHQKNKKVIKYHLKSLKNMNKYNKNYQKSIIKKSSKNMHFTGSLQTIPRIQI